MIEYPSIQNSSKAPRESCVAFNKLDGSSIRVKWTSKQRFSLFGSRTQLIDESHPHLGNVVSIFNDSFAKPLDKIIRREWPNFREVIVFGEYFGENSFAGTHVIDEPHKFILFDVLLGHKNREFVKPNMFVKLFSDEVETPRVIYAGNLTDNFIKEIRENRYGLNEGVVCKGTSTNGASRGKMWMCKIKTQEYIEKLKKKFAGEWEKYGE